MLSLFLGLCAPESSSPRLIWQYCTSSGCSDRTGYIVVDKAYRTTETAAISDYLQEVGVSTGSDSRSLAQRLVTTYNGKKVVGSRVYLLQSSGTSYELFDPMNKEIAYDVDVSQIPCGVSASFYTVEMPSGGSGAAGAAYGGGYCDSSYLGGAGCAAIDIQHANQYAMLTAIHPCQEFGYQSAAGTCDAGNGCGFNPYRYDAKGFWGGTIATSQKVTVVTQFIGTGTVLEEIRRFYVVSGKIVYNPKVTVAGQQFDSITSAFCQRAGFQTSDWHTLNQLAASFARRHVFVFSLWDSDNMQWLDGQSAGNGPCAQQSTANIEASHPGMTVTWSNLKVGDLDSTY
jgi:cellulose 1,4-beta-cellobiosidase